MPNTLPENLIVVSSKNNEETAREIARIANGLPCHFTNGTYANQSLPLQETTLAGFQKVTDDIQGESVLIVAVNSNDSMNNHVKNVSNPADEMGRALFVSEPLAFQHPDKTVVAVFYDDATPLPLYEQVFTHGVNVMSLHKHGNYGTSEKGPVIEGADIFGVVYAFPFYDKEKAVCEDTTRAGDQTAIVKIRDLYRADGPHGAPYLSPDKKILFPVPVELKHLKGDVPSYKYDQPDPPQPH